MAWGKMKTCPNPALGAKFQIVARPLHPLCQSPSVLFPQLVHFWQNVGGYNGWNSLQKRSLKHGQTRNPSSIGSILAGLHSSLPAYDAYLLWLILIQTGHTWYMLRIHAGIVGHLIWRRCQVITLAHANCRQVLWNFVEMFSAVHSRRVFLSVAIELRWWTRKLHL